jgi:DNA-binding protein Fis
MATENLHRDQSVPHLQRPINGGTNSMDTVDKISPEYLDEWKERTFRKEVFELFIEYFCVRQKVPFKQLMGSVEKTILIRVLSQCKGHQRSAAKLLGMKHTTLNEKLKKYNIQFDKKPF